MRRERLHQLANLIGVGANFGDGIGRRADVAGGLGQLGDGRRNPAMQPLGQREGQDAGEHQGQQPGAGRHRNSRTKVGQIAFGDDRAEHALVARDRDARR